MLLGVGVIVSVGEDQVAKEVRVGFKRNLSMGSLIAICGGLLAQDAPKVSARTGQEESPPPTQRVAGPAAESTLTSDGLTFTPDPGVRVDRAAQPQPGRDPDSGAVYLYYTDTSTTPPREMLATSTDGLSFSKGSTPVNRANDPTRTLLPNGVWRKYLFEPQTGLLKSSSSTTGLTFSSDPGVRYTLQAADKGTNGVWDVFVDSKGGVVLLYLADLPGLNNLRRAYSQPGDNGSTFTFDRGNVLGDSGAGGGSNSYVDPKSLLLADGRRRLFVMKGGSLPPQPPVRSCCQIYSFITEDGRIFKLEEGIRLAPSQFTEFPVYSLNDPWVILLPDGRFRMYVAALVGDGSGGSKFVIVSASTNTSYTMHFAHVGNGVGVASDMVFTNPSATSGVAAKVEFFDDNGVAAAVGISGFGSRSSLDFSVPPLGLATISTDGQNPLVTGSAVVASQAPLGGVVRFSISGIGTASVGESQPLAGFIAPVRRKAGGINTGVALRNTESASVTLSLTLRDKLGQAVSTGTRILAARGHLAQFVNELFTAAATEDFEGTLEVRAAGGLVAATVLELGAAAGQFTTLPVTPLR